MTNPDDIYYMKSALNIARRGLGRVAPNPAVGCVIVKDGVVLARARTADGGRPHAETIALTQAGAQAQNSSVYVSLEPCAHHGKTGPCAEALIKAGVGRVVIACSDPDPRTAGKGIAMLREAQIEVVTGVLEDEAKVVNRGFFLTLSGQRPFITLKVATSADGMVAGGAEKWITGKAARARAHLIRSTHDAILAGIGTVLADDPVLTTRVPGLKHHIIRVVLDHHLRIPEESRLVQSASVTDPLIVLHSCKSEDVRVPGYLAKEGVELIEAVDMKAGLAALAQRGITRLLVEGGPRVHGAFVAEGLYDTLAWFKAPQVIGSQGLPALEGGSFQDVCEGMVLSEQMTCGGDMLEIYTRADMGAHALYPVIPLKPLV